MSDISEYPEKMYFPKGKNMCLLANAYSDYQEGDIEYIRADLLDRKTYNSIYCWTNEAYWTAIKEKRKEFNDLLKEKIEIGKKLQDATKHIVEVFKKYENNSMYEILPVVSDLWQAIEKTVKSLKKC